MPRVLEDKLSKCGVVLYCLGEESKAFPQVIVKLFDQEGTAWQNENHLQQRHACCPQCYLNPAKLAPVHSTPERCTRARCGSVCIAGLWSRR